MIALGLEASARIASVALLRGDRFEDADLDLILLEAEQGAARGLAPAIAEILTRHGLRPADVTLLAVSLGPGGYTGTRLALATAKTMACVLDIPILGVPSTLALAGHPSLPSGTILTVLDARKGLLYGARYQRPAFGPPEEVEAPFLKPAEEIARGLSADVQVVGDGIECLRQVAGTELACIGDCVQTAREVLFVAAARYSRGERDRERDLLPLYLRPSEAEILWEQRRLRARAAGQAGGAQHRQGCDE